MERPQGGIYTMGHGIMITRGRVRRLYTMGLRHQRVAGRCCREYQRVRYLQTNAPSFSRFNKCGPTCEIEMVMDGTFKDKTWEWK
jgi:hypothetical protein